MTIPLPEPVNFSDVWLPGKDEFNRQHAVWGHTADQLRAYGEAVRAEERERMMPLIDEAILDAAGAALAGAGYDGDAIEKIAPRVLEMWRGFKSAAAIRAAAPPQCTDQPSEPQ